MRAVLLFSLLFLGCASSEPARVHFDPGRGTSTYTSSTVRVGSPNRADLASGLRVTMQATATCPGQGCTPDEVELAFHNDVDSNSNLDIDSRRLQIIFDGTVRDWEDTSRLHEPVQYAVRRGEFFRVVVPVADFVRIAEARDVSVVFGLTGTSSFRVAFDRRAPFRALAEEMGVE